MIVTGHETTCPFSFQRSLRLDYCYRTAECEINTRAPSTTASTGVVRVEGHWNKFELITSQVTLDKAGDLVLANLAAERSIQLVNRLPLIDINTDDT